jgi:hypothetical protein
MRKRTIRSGLRLLLGALVLIILASFYHTDLADLLSLSPGMEQRFYRLGMFGAAAMGIYGVTLFVSGLLLSPDRREENRVRIAPLFFMLLCALALFFYLFVASFTAPYRNTPLRPGETITI